MTEPRIVYNILFKISTKRTHRPVHFHVGFDLTNPGVLRMYAQDSFNGVGFFESEAGGFRGCCPRAIIKKLTCSAMVCNYFCFFHDAIVVEWITIIGGFYFGQSVDVSHYHITP